MEGAGVHVREHPAHLLYTGHTLDVVALSSKMGLNVPVHTAGNYLTSSTFGHIDDNVIYFTTLL